MSYLIVFAVGYAVHLFLGNEIRHRRNVKAERRQVVEAYRSRNDGSVS